MDLNFNKYRTNKYLSGFSVGAVNIDGDSRQLLKSAILIFLIPLYVHETAGSLNNLTDGSHANKSRSDMPSDFV